MRRRCTQRSTAHLAATALAMFGAAAATGSPTPAAAQEAHVFLARGASGDEDFGTTRGVGVAVAFRINDEVRVQATLDRRESDFERVGTACINPAVNFHCAPEPIRTENSFSSFTVSVLRAWHLADELVRLGGGAGVVIGSTDSFNMPRSGRQAKVFAKETAQTGLMGVFDVQLRPSRAMPLVLAAQWQARYIRLQACIDDLETYDPFCGSDWWHEVQVGIGVRF